MQQVIVPDLASDPPWVGQEWRSLANSEVTSEATKLPASAESIQSLFFTPSAASQAAGKRYPGRMMARKEREPASTRQTIDAHLAAIRAWGEGNEEAFAPLERIRQPALVVHGAHDIMIPTFNAYILSQQIPNAHLILYPDAGHGALFQYAEWFVQDASRFLGRAEDAAGVSTVATKEEVVP
jgi:pimeloyl-ACP methyl ester carboxylesterase